MTQTQNGINAGTAKMNFINSVIGKYPVSENFLMQAMPSVDAIFNELPEESRESLLEITVESFMRQSECEQSFARATKSLEQITGLEKTSRRHQKVATQRTTIASEASVAKAI